jgi:hypothetical protein
MTIANVRVIVTKYPKIVAYRNSCETLDFLVAPLSPKTGLPSTQEEKDLTDAVFEVWNSSNAKVASTQIIGGVNSWSLDSDTTLLQLQLCGLNGKGSSNYTLVERLRYRNTANKQFLESRHPLQLIPLQTTISCAKGKTVKKITGYKPVCPAGYKKK